MSDYKRLTTKDEEGNWQVWEDDYSHPFEALQVAIDRLAELEDKIEQGTLVELPFKPGKNLYYVNVTDIETGNHGYVGNGCPDIVSFQKNLKGEYLFCFRAYFDAVGEEWFGLEDIGDTVFLTREEAEKRLKELQE